MEVPEHISAADVTPGDDPRSDWAPAHAPDGRASYIRKVDVATVLHYADGREETLEAGDFVVWQDGEPPKAVSRAELMDSGGWDLSGLSALEVDAAEQES
jgi:hypothetical protein